MFLRLFKGFKYPYRNLVFSYSQATEAQTQKPVNEILNSLFSIPVQSIHNGNAMKEVSSYMQKLEKRYNELTQSEILKLAVFASTGNVMKKDLHDFLAINLKQQMKSNLCNLNDMSTFMRILAKDWSDDEAVLITKYVEGRKEELTPNSVPSLLYGIHNVKITNKEVADLIDAKAFEFIRYMNINQLEQICFAMMARQKNTTDFWERVEKKILAHFFFLHPKSINCFCEIFVKNSKGSQKFWKAAYDAIEASTSNYENIRFFFPFLAVNNKGNPGIWNKYEEMIEKSINKLNDLELLDNIVFMTKAEKESFVFWKAINVELVKRAKTFDEKTRLKYFLQLAPFEKCFLIQEIWAGIVSKVLKNSSKLSKLEKMKISNILQLLKNKEKIKKSNEKKKKEKLKKKILKLKDDTSAETSNINDSKTTYEKENTSREKEKPQKIFKREPQKKQEIRKE